MDWEMVLRRRPLLLALLALAAVLAAGPGGALTAPPAHAQQAAYDPGQGGYGDDPASGETTSGYGDGGATGYDDGSAGGTLPGDMPATIQLPATTPAPAPMTPTVPGSTLPTVPITRTIAGRVARMRTDGKAAIPRGAPKVVQEIIAAANRIIGKPYKWGGGHARLIDSGYDCSGAVSYALIRAQLLGSPLVSGSLAHWSAAGGGRWVSVYANKGHVYMEVAGLRLDTSPVGDVTHRMGVRWRPPIGRRAGFSTRHPAGL
jgi:cell wall-associated NlpC family hydrolase